MTWDEKFMQAAQLISSWSKDPSTKVGCVIANDDHVQLSGGFNGFPRGVADDGRLLDRGVKLQIVVHAEANAVAAAARLGHPLKGATAYVTLPPCCQCASLLAQAGVVRVVHPPGDPSSKWAASWAQARTTLAEAGVAVDMFVDQTDPYCRNPEDDMFPICRKCDTRHSRDYLVREGE